MLVIEQLMIAIDFHNKLQWLPSTFFKISEEWRRKTHTGLEQHGGE